MKDPASPTVALRSRNGGLKKCRHPADNVGTIVDTLSSETKCLETKWQ